VSPGVFPVSYILATVNIRDEYIAEILTSPLDSVGIPWEWEILLQFRGNGIEHWNGVAGTGENDNTVFSHFSPRESPQAHVIRTCILAQLAS